jgi:hypothetical protein
MSNDKSSLDSNQEDLPVPQTLKINNRKSKYVHQAETKQIFEKQAEEVHNKILSRNEQAYELGKQFLDLMKDKTLPANKGPLHQSVEREVINKLITFGTELNNDTLEQEGMGGISLLMLVFKSTLIMRDKYNVLEYKVEQLEKQLRSSEPRNHVK